MKKNQKDAQHPEVKDIENICEIAGNSKKANSVCKKIKPQKKSDRVKP